MQVQWPSFSWWQLIKILLEYQRHYPQLAARRAHHTMLQTELDCQRHMEAVVRSKSGEVAQKGKAKKAKRPEKIAGEVDEAAAVAAALACRRERVESFLSKLGERREEALRAFLTEDGREPQAPAQQPQPPSLPPQQQQRHAVKA
jgi:hypothetical protein